MERPKERADADHQKAQDVVKALAAQERKIKQLILERDDAEQALSQAYYLVTGRSPEWSNLFGHDQALEDIKDACEVLKMAAKERA
jgi:hypothetical protein